MPLYKLKPSSNFASSTVRTLEGFGIKPKSRNRNTRSDGGRRIDQQSDGESSTDDSEYVENSCPGPGTYHNEANTTSLNVKSKPTRLQFFGCLS